MNFSIVIPVFNEELNIALLVEEIKNALIDNKNNYEIILVNDASTDNSFSVIKKLSKQNSKIIKIVNNQKNLGQSFSLIEGIKKSLYETIITIDGDGQNNPIDLPKLIDKYFSNESVFLVGGIRSKRKDSIIKILSSKIANNIRNSILKDNCIDTGCSLKIFDKKTFMNFPFFNGIHRFLPALFKGYGKETLFVSVDHRYRKHGYSKYGTFNRLFRGIRDMIKVYKIIRALKNNHD